MDTILPADLPAFVDAELHRVLANDWRVERKGSHTWIVEPPKASVNRGCISVSYDIFVKDDHVIVTHGNSDGGLMGLNHIVQNASVITFPWHPFFSWTLGDVLRTLLETKQPNRYGES